jgi:predicted flavoprotein YhiN
VFGQPLKGVAFHAGPYTSRGEAVITKRGLEGGGIYSVSRGIREGHTLSVDLFPDRTAKDLCARLARPRGKASWANHLRKVLKPGAARTALLNEFGRPLPSNPDALAALIKALPVGPVQLAPLDEAISTAGGVTRGALTDDLMLRYLPGVFCAGEMLDWEAPTGGYLLTACLATGRWAGRSAADYLRQNQGV